jgi:hypothetical protein
MEGTPVVADSFAASRGRFEELVGFLDGEGAAKLDHGELERRLESEGRELLRLLQDHLDLRAQREERIEEVVGSDGVGRRYAEAGHARPLATVFGEVSVNRLAYRRKREANLHPADGALNLPAERYSHGLRRLAALEASRGSFDDAVAAIDRASATDVPKRQAEALSRRAAVDFEAFYATRSVQRADDDDVLVISADGKGIVMLPDALRKATAQAAANSDPKLKTRLSKGEKRGRKRMAEVGAVYDVAPVPRSPLDIIGHVGADKTQPPKAKNKWLTASVVDDAAVVISSVFDEAERRDPNHKRTWVALVDGNCHQIACIKAEAAARGVTVTVVVDVVHVLEYLWSSAWSFFAEGDPAAQEWVADKAFSVLEGNASSVAASIRRKATRLGLDAAARKNADTCADYLLSKRPYLDYPRALEKGWPIATGVIEGACRHLVKDRMDLTGARWGLPGAEAVLKLRAIRTNGDFDDYWNFHLANERNRIHQSRYANGVIPAAA